MERKLSDTNLRSNFVNVSTQNQVVTGARKLDVLDLEVHTMQINRSLSHTCTHAHIHTGGSVVEPSPADNAVHNSS